MKRRNKYKLEPTEDFVFKRIFGHENSKKSLLSLLNAILDGNPIIKDLTILNTETQKEGRNNKASRLNIEVSTDDGTIINVELQCIATGDLYSRSVVYASNLISLNTRKGKSYDNPKVISIWIIRDSVKQGIISNRKSPIEEITYCTTPTRWNEGYERFVDKSRIIWIQLSKFIEEVMNNISEVLMNWIKFFDNPNKVKSNDEGIKEAQYTWEKISSSEQVKAQIRAQDKYEMDKASEMYYAKEEGKEEGKLEEKKQIALNMKSKGIEDKFIAECLDIDLDELNELINSK